MEEKAQKEKRRNKQEKAALAKKQSRKAIIAAGEYGLSMSDIISSGSFFIAGWVPVYGSIWLDKIFNVPKDDEGEDKHVSEPTGFTVLGGGTCGKKD